MKTCQSCKWCDFNEAKPNISKCKAPQSYTISMITGEPEYQGYEHCTSHRSGNQEYLCGAEGRWWEEKEFVEKHKIPWYTRILHYFVYGKLK